MAEKLSRSSSFIYLNIAQFFGAGNDNILKQILVFGVAAGAIWSGTLGEGAQAYVSLCLAIPFVFLSGFAGQYSDRYDKRSVSIVTKLAEVAIALVAMWGLWLVNVWIVLTSMVFLSVQSTFFTPAKFGILPEIVDPPKLSRANGTLNMFTYIAIILGGAVGGPIYDAYAPDPKVFPNALPVLWLPGLILVIVAILGAAATFGLPRVTPQNPKLKIRMMFLRTYLDSWKEIRGTALASVILAWTFFYLIVGGIAILILPDYKELLEISATKTSVLLVIMGMSIGLGDFVAGRLSGHGIRPGLIPLGGFATTVLFFWLGVMPLDFWLVCVSLSITGFAAGFVMVPLQTMTQQLSQADERGQVLGLWNCLSFVGIIIGNLMFLVVRRMGVASNHVFILCGVLGLVFVALYYLRWRKPFIKAVGNG